MINMMMWNPDVSKAPTDGTPILYKHRSYDCVLLAFYRDGHIYNQSLMPAPSAIPREWADVASHWMYAPAPPKVQLTYGGRMQMTKAALDVLEERKRQQETKGWTAEHDDEHDLFELTRAGVCYAMTAAGYQPDNALIRRLWPFPEEMRPSDQRRRDLVKAAATIIADIERLDRAAGAA